VPAGANRPNQNTASKVGQPPSATVGTSGSCGTRLGPVTARILILPARAWGAAMPTLATIIGTWPAITSFIEGAEPR
jgi:hypothetical protein